MNKIRTTSVFDESLPAAAKAATIARNVSFFRALGKKAGKTDWAKLVREERDRDRG